MKKLIIPVFAMCLMAADSPEIQVANCERALDQAIRDRDTTAAERWVADEYIHVFPSGAVAEKKAALAALSAGRVASFTWVPEARVHVFGDIAVVSGRRHASEPDVSDVMMISIWVKRNNEWRRVSVQTAPPSDAAPPSAPGSPTADERQLAALDREWCEAESTRDEAALNRILDERFQIYTSSGRNTKGRDAFIEQVRKFTFTSMTSVQRLVEVLGTTATVVTDFTFRRGDGSESPATRAVVIYVKKGGYWRALVEHTVAVASAKQ